MFANCQVNLIHAHFGIETNRKTNIKDRIGGWHVFKEITRLDKRIESDIQKNSSTFTLE